MIEERLLLIGDIRHRRDFALAWDDRIDACGCRCGDSVGKADQQVDGMKFDGNR